MNSKMREMCPWGGQGKKYLNTSNYLTNFKLMRGDVPMGGSKDIFLEFLINAK